MKERNKGIIAYLILTFGIAWSIWAIAGIVGVPATRPEFTLWVLPGAFAPAIACFIVRKWVTQEGFADAGLKPNIRSKWPYYLFAWLLPFFVVGFIIFIASLFGISEPDFSLQRALETYAPNAELPPIPSNTIFVLPLMLMIQALIATFIVWGEEFGWRSYLQIRLLSDRPLLAAVTTGLIWGVWHYPINLMGYQRYENPMFGLLVFPIFTLLLSIIFGWLRLKTESIWAASLGHGATNAIGSSLTVMLFLGGPNWMFVGYNGILAWIPLGIVCAWIIATQQFKTNEIKS